MNARAAHTPGPWTARKAPHGPIDVFDPRGRDVVTVYGGGVGVEDQEANARLIAAAPEMLDLILRASEADSPDEDVRTAWWEARSAILAKAGKPTANLIEQGERL